jgi:hypothetical protein
MLPEASMKRRVDEIAGLQIVLQRDKIVVDK